MERRERGDLPAQVVLPQAPRPHLHHRNVQHIFLNYTCNDEYVVHFCCENGVKELAEKGLEQGGHHLQIVPLWVFQLK